MGRAPIYAQQFQFVDDGVFLSLGLDVADAQLIFRNANHRKIGWNVIEANLRRTIFHRT